MSEGDVALVTGASGAIGRAVALALADQGCEIWLGCYERIREAGEVRDQILGKNGKAQVVAFDVSSYADCQKAIGSLIESRGPVSSFVHCAGIVRHLLLLRTSPDDWDAILRINLGGFFNVSRAVIRGMIQRRSGSIVALGSVAGRRGLEGHMAYAASKAGLIGAALSLAKEVGSYNIRVNVVAPGWIGAGMNQDRPADKVLDRIPLRRLGSPEEVAQLVGFLCSRGASYITGAVIPVSGGLDM